MFIYAANQYHLDKQIGKTVYFFCKNDLQNYLKKQNEKHEDIYRGHILVPLLPTIESKDLNKKNLETFVEFEELVKPEYRFLAMELYNSLIKRK